MTLDDNVLEISLANELQEVAGAAARIDSWCESNALSPDIAYAVNLSIDEILTNTISYGYDDEEPHRIDIVVRLESDEMVIVIADDSRAFDPTATPDPDLEASLEERDVGGLGLFLVHQMMDRVQYERVDERNVVTLTKRVAAGG